MKRTYLKIKVKHLAEEPKIIRIEEQKSKWAARAARGRVNFEKRQASILRVPYIGPEPDTIQMDYSLHLHRVKDLRREARSANVAYGFLKGRSYDEIEKFSWTQPDWNRVKRLAVKYAETGPMETEERFQKWMDEALRGVRPYLVDRDERHPRSQKTMNAWTNSRIGSNSRNAEAA